ncbi:hypothetical protein WMY93_024795 [Mugilogobius chulae]|uniref:Tight junction protein 3 n=1 Tax=Mugilogobius chulae TaxID=88201 RepID=A0AAW0NB23_9GOBI
MEVRFKDHVKPGMEELTIWEQHTITLVKDPKVGFGFALSGGRDKPNLETGDTAVVISDVLPNGPAMGRLFTKDQVVMVNGVSMEDVYSNYTIQTLKTCGKTANITVKRPRKIQIPATTRPTRAASHSNLLENDAPARRPRRFSDGSDNHEYDRYRSRARSSSPNRNGYGTIPLLSTGYKKLPRGVTDKPIRTTLVKKRITDEYGLKLGSQIFIKHMTDTGLAAKEGTLQEGDLILKINGMVTENLSLLETKHLVEKSRGKLTMTVLRDDRKFLVSIPEVVDSAPNSEDDRQRESSSELEDISDLDEEITTHRTRQPTREKRTRRIRAEPWLWLALGTPHLPQCFSTATAKKKYARFEENSSKYKSLSGLSTLPNPKSSPMTPTWSAEGPPSISSRPRKPVSESDSDPSPSPPPTRQSSSTLDRYKPLPDLAYAGMRASPIPVRNEPYRRVNSPVRDPRPDSESDSEESTGPPQRLSNSQDSYNRYRSLPDVNMGGPVWSNPGATVSKPPRRDSESESEASYTSVPRRESTNSEPSNKPASSRYRALPESRIVPVKQEAPQRTPSYSRPPPDDSSESDQLFHLRRSGSSEREDNPPAKPADEPIYLLPPDSLPASTPGYSSDVRSVSFVKEGSVGLRLVGGNDVGIFVGGVQPNSPAYEQGMKEGDQIMQVNKVDFGHFTREEAANFLLNIRSGERVEIGTQNKMDLFRIVDTMYKGKLGSWMAIRMGNDLHELDKGTIPNQSRAEKLASMEQAQRAIGARTKTESGPRAEFWKIRGLRGNKKNDKTRRSRDDLLQLTIQGKFPAYERVLLREANFKRPIVILGPLNDIAMEKLARELPDEFEVAEMVARSGSGDSASTVIKLDTVRRIAEKDKHPLLDITPTAIERLNYIQYHPMVLFLDPHSRKDVKAMRQRYSPNSNKSSRRLYAQALKLRKHCSHLFSSRVDLQPHNHVWYEVLKDKIRHQQSKPVWVSEVTLEAGGEQDLDALDQTTSDYLSAASDLEDTDGEAFTDDAYTDNEDLEEAYQNQDTPRAPRSSRVAGSALARSSEPAYGDSPIMDSDRNSDIPSYKDYREIPPLMHVPEPRSYRQEQYSPPQSPNEEEEPTQRSFTDSDFSALDVLPDEQSADEEEEEEEYRASPPLASLSAIEEKLEQARQAEPQAEPEKKTPTFIVLAHHHQAVQFRRTQIRGSDSSDEDEDVDNDDDETEDIEWGPATEL